MSAQTTLALAINARCQVFRGSMTRTWAGCLGSVHMNDDCITKETPLFRVVVLLVGIPQQVTHSQT